MVKESEKYAEKDKKRRELIEEINKAESVLHDTESKMDEYKDQLPKDEYEKLKEGIVKIREKISSLDRENDTVEAIKPLLDEFQKDSLKLFELAYKKVWKLIIVFFLDFFNFYLIFYLKIKMQNARESSGSSSSSSSSSEQEQQQQSDSNEKKENK